MGITGIIAYHPCDYGDAYESTCNTAAILEDRGVKYVNGYILTPLSEDKCVLIVL